MTSASTQLLETYFTYHLHLLPNAYITLDTNRMTLAYFALAGLDVLGQLQQFLNVKNTRQDLIEWIYVQQVLPDANNHLERCGFRGSPASNSCSSFGATISQHELDEANLSQTYTALCCLLILGDDLQRVQRDAIIGSLRDLQSVDGNFRSCYSGGESDLRFVYCACAMSALLNDWSGFDIVATVRYIQSCQRYDGAFGLQPDGEGHGGSTYLAVASLSLLDKLDQIPDRESLLFWCITNQGCGYRGRPNKPEDSCYSFWLGATLRMLQAEHMSNPHGNGTHLLTCAHTKMGGFSKHSDGYPDLMHSYMALAGLSIIDEIQISEATQESQDNTNASPWKHWHLRHLDVRLGLLRDRTNALDITRHQSLTE